MDPNEAILKEPFKWFLYRFHHPEHQIIPIRDSSCVVGRGNDANFIINPSKYKTVSRNHCMLQMVDGKPTITDCHSRRGTFVNNERLDKFQPGRIELREGDIVGIAHRTEDVQQYFKFHGDVLKYRVCRKIANEEAVVISDDEEEVDVKDVKLIEIDDEQSTDGSEQVQSIRSSSEELRNGTDEDLPKGVKEDSPNDTEEELPKKMQEKLLNGSPKSPSPEPGRSGLRLASVISIPEELMKRSSFEEEYDAMLCASKLNMDGYESDTEPCVVPTVSYNDNEIITLSDDDEYTDVQCSQMVIEEVQQEMEEEDDVVFVELADMPEEETNLWALKLKPDVDATRRYKKRDKDIKEEKEPSKREKVKQDGSEKSQKSSSRHKKHRSSSSRSSEEDSSTGHRVDTAKEKVSHERKRSSSDSKEGDVKKPSRHSSDSDRKDSKKDTTPSTSRHTTEPASSAVSWQIVESIPSTSRHTNGSAVSQKTSDSDPATSRERSEPTTSSSKYQDLPILDEEQNRTVDQWKKPLPNKPPPPEQQPIRLKIRRNSVATWTEPGARKPSGTIEIALPEKSKPSKTGPLWLQSHGYKSSPAESGTGPEDASSKPKSNLKRRGSVSSVEEAQAMIKKKLKRRYSVSDRNVFDFQPIVTTKVQKDKRKSRLMEINEKKKQQEKGATILIEPQPLGKKSSLTKPKVKFTPNNRGSFLTAPAPPPPASRVTSTSRPTSTDESIVCTQSTTLEQLPHELEGLLCEEIIDMRPKKLTFESVARVSNVDRPLPTAISLAKPVSMYRPIEMEPSTATFAKPQPPPSSSSGGSGSSASNNNNNNSSSSSNTLTHKTPSSTASTATASSSRKSATPQEATGQKQPLVGILKKLDKPTTKKSVTIMLELNQIREIENCLDEMPQEPEQEPPPPKVTQKEIQEQVLWQELDLLAEVLEWPTKWLLQQESELIFNGPFASEGKMMPKLENYDTYEMFRSFHLPFLKRELWHDIYTCARVLKNSMRLNDLTVDKAEHVNLCKLIGKVRIKMQGKEQLPSLDFGIIEYHSLLGHTCSLFVALRNTIRDHSAPLRDSNGVQGLSFVYTMYAAGRELEGLRSGRNFFFRPLARIHLYLRRCNAISQLEHSPLLPNIISPTINKKRLLDIETELAQQPNMRINVARHMEAGALNPGQMEVVSAVLDECRSWDVPTISLIQGPPGTGKSRVIGHLVQELMRLGYRNERMKVLVCASSNTAVDVIVKNLMKLQQRAAISDRYNLIRTGTKNKVDPECYPVFIDKLVQDEVNQQNRVPDARRNDGTLQNVERERNMLAKRIKMAENELACGRSVNMEKLSVMKRRLQNLEEVVNPGATSSSSFTSEGRKKQEIKARICILQKADIVCTTLGSSPMLASYCNNLKFGACIIDEATQCTELCSLLPLQYNISKLVLVGDINQLPATVLDPQCVDAGFRSSLYSRLYQSYADIGGQQPEGLKMLKTQYRMHPKICLWPNRYFYNNILKNAPCTEMMRKSIPLKPYMVISLSYDQELTQAQYEIYNKDEIVFVVEMMKQVVRCCDKNASFAIITPYVRHKDEMMQSLRSAQLKQVEVHSIDSVQGKEFDVVIISLARSNGAGFLNHPERINVAITRARQCLVLCGNFASLKHKPFWSSLLEDAEKRKVYYHLEEHDAQADGQVMVKNIMERLRMQ